MINQDTTTHKELDFEDEVYPQLSTLSRSYNWTKVMHVLEQALRNGTKVRPRSFGTGIAACDRAALWQHAVGFLSRAPVPNLIMWNSAISACARARRWTAACLLLWQMSKASLRRDEISYNSAMRAFAGAGSSTSRWQAAALLYHRINATRLCPSIRSVSTVTSLCAQGNAWHAALAFFWQAQEAGLSMDAACYSSVLVACARSRRWQRSLQIFWECAAFITPDLACFNAAISACERGGDWKGALVVLQNLHLHSLRADRITHNAVISACEKGSEWLTALAMLDAMEAKGPVDESQS